MSAIRDEPIRDKQGRPLQGRWALQCKHLLAVKPFDGPWYWTANQDYTLDLTNPAALTFLKEEDATRYLRSHKHLARSLMAVGVLLPATAAKAVAR